MTTLEVILLALIQGLTEFLPISSSAHLILPQAILGWREQGLAFDVAVHVGTLLAVLLYFRKEVFELTTAWFSSFKGEQTRDSQLAWWIIIGTIPAALIAYLGKSYVEEYARSASVIAATTIIFGLLLWWADVKARQHKDINQVGWKGALIIGLAQAIALIPGTSRSGITITAGLMLGLDRGSAARFSFLLSIPIIALAGGYQGLGLVTSAEAVDWTAILLGTGLSFISAFACIHYFLIFVERVGMMPFVIYRLLLGAVLIFFII
ncbi:undecaprenyl-diphosphate phosphatase [Flocculibacter collagenilyticus]|uniref:undecaprenyl-diphosphate phosphatase n=1 Tax=Flocculibacter collagenilyticus TaxID=2744479 RepID=UPI0018F708FF|nr:undecaprenyl-diphosphate phosphatase [Flocculibacter collagenilyticus]